jgi:MYXO-CTERM domain-containing protein
MSTPTEPTDSDAGPGARSGSTGQPLSEADRIRAEIVETRAELSDTVEQLGAKLDVKARVADKQAEVTETVKAKVDEGVTTAKQSAAKLQEAATDEQGNPTPQAFAAAGGVFLLLVLLLRRRRRRRRALS